MARGLCPLIPNCITERREADGGGPSWPIPKKTGMRRVGLPEPGEVVRIAGQAGRRLRIGTAEGNRAFVQGSLPIGIDPGLAPGGKDAEDRKQAPAECEKRAVGS